ncbi:hypothetical protein K466DRAFT_27620 [Polyporus arcularius HHB13444]|uniref:Uncharacterized protein n=1 Tax=Polyporus arcularius HHB13444 TaxID=1314778 RepID=A0A5C3NQF0_9APHY|nr:hypothetical protein K466DRAFT_27620 [Polyporus arcularius HHB13444]
MYNSGACIYQLPIELLTHIFRAAGHPRTSSADAIRLTQVYRSWRSVIHHTPAFWVDFLQFKASVAHPRESSIVLAREFRSQLYTRFGSTRLLRPKFEASAGARACSEPSCIRGGMNIKRTTAPPRREQRSVVIMHSTA